MKKFSRFFVSLAFFFFTTSVFADPTHLTILHFNDFHARFEGTGSKNDLTGGAARMATIIRQIQEENKVKGAETIVLFGGDAFSGSLISSQFQGEAEIDFFNEMKITAAALGNHEFDYMLPTLQKRLREATYPLLAANIFWKKDNTLFTEPTRIVTLPRGLKIGFIGLTTVETKETTYPGYVDPLNIIDPLEATARYWKELDEKGDIQIAVTHLGVTTEKKLAATFPGFEAIIGGHDHVETVAKGQHRVGEIPVCQVPPYGRYLGRIDLEIDGRKAKLLESRVIPVDSMVTPDVKMASLIKKYNDQLDRKVNRVVGKIAVPLMHDRRKESPLGNLVADAMREKTGTEIALMNSGGIRRDLDKGRVTLKQLSEMIPFGNRIVTLKLRGNDLERTLKHSLSRHVGGAFLQVSGVTFKVKNNLPYDIRVNGEPIKKDRLYTATSVDFLIDGGDQYLFLKEMPHEQPGGLLLDAVVEYFRNRKFVNAPNLDRIVFDS